MLLGSAAPGAGLDVALGLGAFSAGLYAAGFPSVWEYFEGGNRLG